MDNYDGPGFYDDDGLIEAEIIVGDDDEAEGNDNGGMMVIEGDDDHDNDDDDEGRLPSGFRCDDISSILALSFELKIPIFDAGVLGTKSGASIRIGSGAFSSAAISRFLSDTYPDRSWSIDLHEGFQRRAAGGKVVAKQFVMEHLGQRSSAMRQLGQELRILAHPPLRGNPNIVDIVALAWDVWPFGDWDEEHRWPLLLLLEYADCGTLEQFFDLDGIDYIWDVKLGLLHDIATGLETLSDAGVCHGDLKPANVLVFRTGPSSFRAKICDFGSAIVSVDFGTDAGSARLEAYTPPWEAPESISGIQLDELHRVDLYSLGLLACYIALDGQELFGAQAAPGYALPTDADERHATIREWKRNDEVLGICEAVFRGRYPPAQESILLELCRKTLRADPQRRAEDYKEIKRILKPQEHAPHPEEMAELLAYFQKTTIHPCFDLAPERSIPNVSAWGNPAFLKAPLSTFELGSNCCASRSRRAGNVSCPNPSWRGEYSTTWSGSGTMFSTSMTYLERPKPHTRCRSVRSRDSAAMPVRSERRRC